MGARKLSVSCGLTQFPSEILDLADSLEILDLSNNRLKSLPKDFSLLKNLKAAFFANNEFEEIPEILARCPQLSIIGFKSNQIRHVSDEALSPTLRWLILTHNQLKQLPPKMGTLSKLQKLMLAGNQLSSLPDTMAACQNLELIRLSANRLTELPRWLLSLPRLSWLAYAGNPFCIGGFFAQQSLSSIDWSDLSLEGVLGEGASGVISKGLWHASTQTRAVAVKVFKGEMTSDGLPVDEMLACIAAGSHPNLVNVLGKVENHPNRKEGLILSLIPPDYRNLGGPPNLETCTRDTYAPNTTFSLNAILRTASGIAAVAAHLHCQGIMHGDLYAHNILANGAGDCLLGDFGAASFYNLSDTDIGQSLEQLEVRAFGCLLQDLADRCSGKDTTDRCAVVDRLRLLQQQCLHPTPAQRPQFATLYSALRDLQLKVNIGQP
jgi:Protein tyrosine and serine/threonine kinase/Leucine rich repeat